MKKFIILLLMIICVEVPLINVNAQTGNLQEYRMIDHEIKKGTISTISRSELPNDIIPYKVNSQNEYKELLNNLSKESNTFEETTDIKEVSNYSIMAKKSNKYPYNKTATYTANSGTFKVVETAVIQVKNSKKELAIKSKSIKLTGFTYSLKLTDKHWNNSISKDKKTATVKCSYNIRHYIATPIGEIRVYDVPHSQSFKYSVNKGIYDKKLK